MKKVSSAEAEADRVAARKFWDELHPFHRIALAADFEQEPFPWQEWFFARAEGGPFINELRLICRIARRDGTLEMNIAEDGTLLREELPQELIAACVAPQTKTSSSPPSEEHAQRTLPW